MQDYIYALITGYVDPPAGVEVREGLNYNPYFPGGAIGMGRVLYDGLVEYPDGTKATSSQMAKDVTTFLSWASEPELDQRKKMGLQAVIILTALTGLSIWVKKFKWTPIKSRKIGESQSRPVSKTDETSLQPAQDEVDVLDSVVTLSLFASDPSSYPSCPAPRRSADRYYS